MVMEYWESAFYLFTSMLSFDTMRLLKMIGKEIGHVRSR